MIVDYFCFTGTYPFGQPGTFSIDALLKEMDADEVDHGYVTDIGSIFRKEPTDANIAFVERCAPHSKRLSPLPVVDLSTETFEKDITIYSEMGVKGIRIAPNYHGYSLSEDYCRRLGEILSEKKLMLFVARQVEDVRFQPACFGVKALSLQEVSCLTENTRIVQLILNNFTATEIQNALDSRPQNVLFDISAFDSSFNSMETLIEQLGAEAFVFGSMIPILSQGAVLCNLRKSLLNSDDIKTILEK